MLNSVDKGKTEKVTTKISTLWKRIYRGSLSTKNQIPRCTAGRPVARPVCEFDCSLFMVDLFSRPSRFSPGY